ncbi:MAG: PH domain-containing protein [Alteraurantiacibacter sp.]
MSEGRAEIGEWSRVDRLSVAVSTLKIAAQALIPLAFVSFSAFGAGGADGLVPLLSSFGVLLILAGVAAVGWLQWYRTQYRIGENDIRLEQGVISRSARSVPYDRIQDVSLEQKLLPRLLGLVEVKFETGAGGKDELALAYVREAEGERLREVVRGLVEEAAEPEQVAAPVSGFGRKALRAESSNAAAPAPAFGRARPLFEMPPQRLFTYGLFSFSLVIFAVLVGAAQQFEFLLPFDVWDYVGTWFEDERYAEIGRTVAGIDTGARILGIATFVLTVIGVGVLSGVAKTFLMDWDFRLERTAKGFRRRRGLLTKTDVVMPVHRVQALVVSTGWLRRRFGWHGLSFISLAQDSGGANHDVAPFAKMDEIAPIAQEAGFDLPDEAQEWRRPSARYYVDRATIRILLIAALIGGGIAVLSTAGTEWTRLALPLSLVAVGLSLFIAARETYRWNVDRHALDLQQVISRRGWLSPRTVIANRVKLHSVEIARGPLGAIGGYCHLVFGMAGGRFGFYGLRREDARKMRAAVLDSIAAVDFAKLPK